MSANLSKSRIDKAGSALAKGKYLDEIEYIELEEDFDEYRKMHLEPLTRTTSDLQKYLSDQNINYYIAQRLKRKPQIIRKLQRLPVRLSQLQDIAGCRIIVDYDNNVDEIKRFVEKYSQSSNEVSIERFVDYRGSGRDESGYRAMHFVFYRDGRFIELQIRSRVQHYWAESIERTSVIYGYHLKEGEGNSYILRYFHLLSDAFHEFESGREPTLKSKALLARFRKKAESIIELSDRGKVLDSFVNDGIINALVDKEASSGVGINNWILIFDWKSGRFVSWDVAPVDPDQAIRLYVRYENQFPAEAGFEVVLIGSSDVSTVQKTHSHYFGIEELDSVLERPDVSLHGFRKKMDLDIESRLILQTMYRKNFWGSHRVRKSNLKTHNCSNIMGFDDSLANLIKSDLVIEKEIGSEKISLNTKLKARIEEYV